MSASPMAQNALLVVDVQNDFTTGTDEKPAGSLAVPGSERIFGAVNMWIKTFMGFNRPVIFTFDFHPPTTPHFDKWPVHCVQDTEGSELDKRVFFPDTLDSPVYFIYKGLGKDDGYSAFSEPQQGLRIDPFREDTVTEIDSITEVLTETGTKTLYVVGLATDFCVKHSVLDALARGIRVVVFLDACAAVFPNDVPAVVTELTEAGAEVFWGTERLDKDSFV